MMNHFYGQFIHHFFWLWRKYCVRMQMKLMVYIFMYNSLYIRSFNIFAFHLYQIVRYPCPSTVIFSMNVYFLLVSSVLQTRYESYEPCTISMKYHTRN